MNGPTIQGAEALIAKDPGAYWDTATNKVKGSTAGAQSPRVFPIPLYDPIVYDSGKRNGRTRGSGHRQLDRVLPRVHRGERNLGPDHSDRRHPRRQPRPGAHGPESQGAAAGRVATTDDQRPMSRAGCKG